MTRPLHSMCFAALVFFVLFPLPAFSQEDRIVVGSKNFMENKLLAEIFAQLIEARTELSVERRLGLAGTQSVLRRFAPEPSTSTRNTLAPGSSAFFSNRRPEIHERHSTSFVPNS